MFFVILGGKEWGSYERGHTVPGVQAYSISAFCNKSKKEREYESGNACPSYFERIQ